MTERIQHPRAAKGLTPPARVHVAQRDTRPVDEEGYFECPDGKAPAIKQRLAQKYDVEFDDTDVVLDEDEDVDDAPAEESLAEDESAAEEADEETVDEFDLEAFLDEGYTDRAAAVEAGEVDAHLEAIEEAETSETVTDAIAARRDTLADAEE